MLLIRVYLGTPAGEGVDGVDGSEEEAVGADEAGSVAELEHVETLLVVETRLPHAQCVVEGQHL